MGTNIEAPLIVIGLSGKMGVGKSTIARKLLELYGDKAVLLSFAGFLKEEAAEKFSFPLDWCYSAKGKENVVTVEGGIFSPEERAMTVRELLQCYGTDIVRAGDKAHWVNAMRHAVSTARKCGKYVVVIDDVRFPNEAEFIRQQGGLLVRLEPYGGIAAKGKEHESETALDAYADWDMRIRPKKGLEHTGTVARVIKILSGSLW